MESIFSIPVRIYIEDTDAGGIVFYVNYLKYMERARTEFLRTVGIAKPALIDDGKLLVVASLDVNYMHSAKLDDELMVTAELEKIARTYMVFQQRVLREGLCLCRSTIKVACIISERARPCAFPKYLSEALAEYESKRCD